MAGSSTRAGIFRRFSVGGESWNAFIPAPLPPLPELQFGRLLQSLDIATQAIGRLDGAASLLIDPPLFLYMYVRKEALLSSQIEGTQSSLSDLLLFEAHEAPGAPLNDVVEVSSYVAAMDYGLSRLRAGFPLSLRLICEIHAILLERGRGKEHTPGSFRISQNWIGGTRPGNARYVPPPVDIVIPAMGDLENFLHSDHRLPALIEAGLAHVQFETIHPFLDGNGRLGRLLVTLLLCERHVIHEPLLYLSLYLKEHRTEYYDLLTKVREHGAWEDWLVFFLEGVATTANAAAKTARQIVQLFEEDRRAIAKSGRSAVSMHSVLALLQRAPLTTIRDAAMRLSISQPTASSALARLESLGIVKEISGRQRTRLYAYDRYLDILNEGTEPL